MKKIVSAITVLFVVIVFCCGVTYADFGHNKNAIDYIMNNFDVKGFHYLDENIITNGNKYSTIEGKLFLDKNDSLSFYLRSSNTDKDLYLMICGEYIITTNNEKTVKICVLKGDNGFEISVNDGIIGNFNDDTFEIAAGHKIYLYNIDYEFPDIDNGDNVTPPDTEPLPDDNTGNTPEPDKENPDTPDIDDNPDNNVPDIPDVEEPSDNPDVNLPDIPNDDVPDIPEDSNPNNSDNGSENLENDGLNDGNLDEIFSRKKVIDIKKIVIVIIIPITIIAITALIYLWYRKRKKA